VSRPKQLPSIGSQIHLEVRGPGEWIVSGPPGGHALHIYTLSPGDWLVSEVGRDSEGRGADLSQALAALATGAATPSWWALVVEALDDERQS